MLSDDVLKAILKKLEKKYEYIKHLGGGEFSNVYLVKHKISGKEHALKILDYHYLLQRLKKENPADSKHKFDKIKRRFVTEAKLYEKINHPNIVKIHETGLITDHKEDIDIPYFIMNYIKGSSLSGVLESDAPLGMDRVLSISKNVLNALETIHQDNIVHRDLKPANIMIEEATGKAVIIDFGIAKDIVEGTRLTTTGALLGSPMYMAPEQFIDSSNVGPEIDIYSFGAVLFEMVTGQTPFKGSNFLEIMHAHRRKSVPNVREKNPALPPGMDTVVSKAMAKDPNKRYKSAKDFWNALKKIDEGKKPRSPIKYLIPLLVVIIAAAFFLIDPFSLEIMKGKAGKDKEVREEPLKKKIEVETVKKNRINKMHNDFEALKIILDSDNNNSEKVKQCRAFLDEHRDVPVTNETTLMISRIKQFIARVETEEEYRGYIDAVKKSVKGNDYRKAEEQLKKAREIKDSGEVRELSKTIEKKAAEWNDYNAAQEKIDLKKYLSFKKKHPVSVYIPDLKNSLKAVEKNLPPEKYWERPIAKNKKGYYRLTFDKEHNRHTMIYIPRKNIWIDKYEVSNLQFRSFRKSGELSVKKGSKLIHEGDGFPAVVTYEDAQRYCSRYGFRLPRIDEWEHAAGKGQYTYPWGDELPGEGGSWRANFDSLDDEGKDERDGFIGTAPVKSFESFSSPFGVVNAAGNVWEWVQGRILKGGSFFSSEKDLMIKNSIAGRSKDTQGFRCVKDEN